MQVECSKIVVDPFIIIHIPSNSVNTKCRHLSLTKQSTNANNFLLTSSEFLRIFLKMDQRPERGQGD